MTKSKYQYNSVTCRIVKFSKLKIQVGLLWQTLSTWKECSARRSPDD